MLVDPYHPQVELESSAGTVKVDEQLAGVLRWCWEKDIETEYSCQGDLREKAYIMFKEARDAEKFLRETSKLSGYLRGRVHSAQPYGQASGERWELVAFPIDDRCGSCQGQGCDSGEIESRIRISVRFPHLDIEMLERAIGRKSGNAGETEGASARRLSYLGSTS